MFDLGWAEMAVIMLVALIIIGPKDLPKVARTIGHWTGKARALARDFQRSLDDMAREAELDEIKKSIDRAGSVDFKGAVKSVVDPDDDFERAFDMAEKGGAAKPGKRPSNVRKPAEAVRNAALPEAAEPKAQPMASPTAPNSADDNPVPVDKAPADAGAEPDASPRG